MGGARGIVQADLLGRTFRLRMSLRAVDEIETRLGGGLISILRTMNSELTLRFGNVLVVFQELCEAGGTPLSDEQVDDLMMSDMYDMVEAIQDAAVASGAIELGEAEKGGESGEATTSDADKKKPTPREQAATDGSIGTPSRRSGSATSTSPRTRSTI